MLDAKLYYDFSCLSVLCTSLEVTAAEYELLYICLVLWLVACCSCPPACGQTTASGKKLIDFCEEVEAT